MRKKLKISMSKKSISELNRAALSARAEAEMMAAMANGAEEAEEELDEKAKMALEEARVLTEAANAMDQGAEEEHFVPTKEEQPLFDEIHAMVTAENEVDEGFEKGRREILEKLNEEPESLQGAIDEKIQEEYNRQEEENFRNYVLEDMEKQQ